MRANQPREQSFIRTSCGRTAYTQSGRGPVALFLHGLPLSGYEWRAVIEDLAPVRRCIALDQMGLGNTEVHPDADLSYAGQARMIAEFLDAADIDAVDLVGNDTGGGVSQLFASLFPARVRTLTLTNCEVHDHWPNALLKGFYDGVAAGAVAALMQCMLTDLELAREQLGALVYEDPRTFSEDTLRVCIAPIVATPARIALFQRLCQWQTCRQQIVDSAPRLRASTARAQVIWGTGDVVFDSEPSLAWLEANLGGLERVTRVPNGKLFFPEEHPRLVSTLLAEFGG